MVNISELQRTNIYAIVINVTQKSVSKKVSETVVKKKTDQMKSKEVQGNEKQSF